MVRILIIEDDEEMRSLLKDFLEEEGVVTDAVGNGADAIPKLAKESFHLVITDIRMPGLTGLDLLPKIRKLQPQAFILVITAFGNEEMHRRSMEGGATAYFEKPIHLQNFRTLMHQLVPSKERKVKEARDDKQQVKNPEHSSA
jgi:two-component system, NtrC family, response regulator PilR